eukprot:TRINITY_DN3272_c0_g3_i3.p1 TRINITY_DN3272_c0_g3~~TRINITY_DN3272_c0_g3_i3.p1  ORF type:complete len:523 (-),score=140.71 TRINITY_DN3272_c0_g3_i3:1078-2646(-)
MTDENSQSFISIEQYQMLQNENSLKTRQIHLLETRIADLNKKIEQKEQIINDQETRIHLLEMNFADLSQSIVSPITPLDKVTTDHVNTMNTSTYSSTSNLIANRHRNPTGYLTVKSPKKTISKVKSKPKMTVQSKYIPTSMKEIFTFAFDCCDISMDQLKKLINRVEKFLKYIKMQKNITPMNEKDKALYYKETLKNYEHLAKELKRLQTIVKYADDSKLQEVFSKFCQLYSFCNVTESNLLFIMSKIAHVKKPKDFEEKIEEIKNSNDYKLKITTMKNKLPNLSHHEREQLLLEQKGVNDYLRIGYNEILDDLEIDLEVKLKNQDFTQLVPHKIHRNINKVSELDEMLDVIERDEIPRLDTLSNSEIMTRDDLDLALDLALSQTKSAHSSPRDVDDFKVFDRNNKSKANSESVDKIFHLVETKNNEDSIDKVVKDENVDVLGNKEEKEVEEAILQIQLDDENNSDILSQSNVETTTSYSAKTENLSKNENKDTKNTNSSSKKDNSDLTEVFNNPLRRKIRH